MNARFYFMNKMFGRSYQKDSDWWRDLSENGGVVLKKSLAQMRPMFNRQLVQLEKMTEREQLLDVGAGGEGFWPQRENVGGR